IRIIYVTWGITNEELASLLPAIVRGFKYGKDEVWKVGRDMGVVKLPCGTVVTAMGRMLMRNKWNTALYGRFNDSQRTAIPQAHFHKCRPSAFWAGSTDLVDYLKTRGIKTLLFAGVQLYVEPSMLDAINLGS
ncbi:hypothetical protein B0H63DRAFT_399348, partial [Podospora didyma]